MYVCVRVYVYDMHVRRDARVMSALGQLAARACRTVDGGVDERATEEEGRIIGELGKGGWAHAIGANGAVNVHTVVGNVEPLGRASLHAHRKDCHPQR
jgi:hypothetical protein